MRPSCWSELREWRRSSAELSMERSHWTAVLIMPAILAAGAGTGAESTRSSTPNWVW